MTHMFTLEGEAALASALACSPLLAFDFDGTLAPIVTDPDDARIPAPVARRLDRLASLLPVAIITGRAVADVRERLTFSPRFVVGNHGAEDPDGIAHNPGPTFDTLRTRLKGRRADLLAVGVTAEDKGDSMALHYRLAPDVARAFRAISHILDGLGPEIHVYGGKRVVNVVAARSPDKAQAIASLVERCAARSVVFFGDDINDEPVFARNEPTWLTVRVGRDNPNTRARFFIDSSSDMAVVLDRVLTHLDARPG